MHLTTLAPLQESLWRCIQTSDYLGDGRTRLIYLVYLKFKLYKSFQKASLSSPIQTCFPNHNLYILPMRRGFIKGRVRNTLKVDDSWPSALTTFFFVVIPGKCSQQWCALCCSSDTLVFWYRGCPSLTNPGIRSRRCTHFDFTVLFWK